MNKELMNIHPGEILLEDFLKPLEFFGKSPSFWLSIQAHYDLVIK